jgi:hypothetical protein
LWCLLIPQIFLKKRNQKQNKSKADAIRCGVNHQPKRKSGVNQVPTKTGDAFATNM